jgi:UDPglucose 6-dehydrogenase
MREAPSLDILPPLVAAGAEIVAYDPGEPPEAPRLLPGVTLVGTAAEAATGADLLVVLTDWQSFGALDLAALARAMRTPHMLDLRNLFEGEDVRAAGFARYEGLGAAPLDAAALDAAASA